MIASYNDLTLGKYLAIEKLIDENPDDLDLQVVAVLSGFTADELLNMPLEEYAKLRDAASFLYFSMPTEEVKKGYHIGPWYLVPVKNFRHILTSQYIDFNEYVKLASDDFLVQALSCFLVPADTRYNEGYDVFEVQKAIKDEMRVADALALKDFFLERSGQSMRHILAFSERLIRRTNKETRKEWMSKWKEARAKLETFIPSGLGSRKSMRSARSRAVLGPQYIR